MSAATARPAERQAMPRDGLKYSEITPEILTILRLDKALQDAYGDDRSGKIVEGYELWRRKLSRSSRELSQTTGGVR